MSINISWKADKIECLPGHYGIEKFISKVWYSVNGTLTVGSVTHTGTTEGFADIWPSGTEFSQFDDLTEEQVISWVWANGVDRVMAEAEVARQIDLKLNPPVITIDSPWA
jgi:hypothetical protein